MKYTAVLPMPIKTSWKFTQFDNNVILIDNGPPPIKPKKRVFDAREMYYCHGRCMECACYHCKLEEL